MKVICVAAAVITDGRKLFATARGYGDYKGWWEFPGGKVEPGESSEQALVREIREELTAQIQIDRFLQTVEYDYPAFHLSMDCYLCHVVSGELTLLEAQEAKWLTKETIRSVAWLPPDEMLLDIILEEMEHTWKSM